MRSRHLLHTKLLTTVLEDSEDIELSISDFGHLSIYEYSLVASAHHRWKIQKARMLYKLK